MVDDGDTDDEREFTPAEEIVFRLDRIVDDLDTVERLVASGEVPVTDEQRRRMRTLLIRLSDDADELFDIATAAGARARRRLRRERISPLEGMTAE
jgi:hypothetical protein